MSNNRVSLALLVKRSSENLFGDIDEVVLQMVYGNSRKLPGDEKSPSQRLMTRTDNDNDGDILTEVEPTPFHIAVGYDAFKTREIMELAEKYPGQVMAYGFFTCDVPSEAVLIAKTLQEFEERTISTTYEEKIVIQLAKTNPDCFMAFTELGPSYMSSDAEVGENDCKIFFPPDYNAVEEEIQEVKRKTKKKGKPKVYAQEETTSTATSDLNKEQSELDHEELEEPESEEEKIEDSAEVIVEEVANEVLVGADKATSPIEGDKVED